MTLVVRMTDSSAVSFGAYYTMTTSNFLKSPVRLYFGSANLTKEVILVYVKQHVFKLATCF